MSQKKKSFKTFFRDNADDASPEGVDIGKGEIDDDEVGQEEEDDEGECELLGVVSCQKCSK